MITRESVATIVLVFLTASVHAQPTSSEKAENTSGSEEIVRAAVSRALPFIESRGLAWMEQKKCASCHHSTFMIWAHNAAADRGFAIDATELAGWNEWTRDFRSIRGRDREDLNKFLDHKVFQSSPDEVSQLLLGRRLPRDASPNFDQERKWAFAMATHLLDGQEADGSWKAGGQLPMQKRPSRETTEVTTMWALLAMDSARPSDEEVQRVRNRAANWLTNTTGESTEWWAVKMMWESGRGNGESAAFYREKLLQSQDEDGGWGWLVSDQSDALGTGIALYALLRDGLSREHDTIHRAIAYLHRSQADDGSWPVKGTKKNKSHRVEATATYWGTCWATIGMLQYLPVVDSK